MKAIIYARVSTEEQKRKGYSIEAQIEACRAYAKAKGWDVVLEFKEAKSGKSAETGSSYSGFQSHHGQI